jgi:exopolysaccharide biosynthesis polyprenyl glycosylphosphotransferase
MNIVRRKEILALFLGDIFVYFISLYLTLTLRFSELPDREVLLTHLIPFSFLFIVSILVSFIVGLYEKHTLVFKSRLPAMLTRVQIVNAILAISFFYFIPYFNITPKVILFIYLVVSLVLMVAWRMAIAETLGLRRRTRALLLAPKTTEVNDLYNEITQNSRYGTHFVNWVDLSGAVTSEEIASIVRSQKVTFIVADFADQKVNELMPTLYRLIFSGVEFADIQNVYEEVFDRVPLSLVDDTWFLENVSSSAKGIFDLFKRAMDIVLAVVGGAISLVFYPFVYLAIKIDDRGPIFIVQERVGKNGRTIKIRKFRSMTTNDEGEFDAKKNRETRVGRFLRKTRIDELPQIWSVLAGDLSLIGPRPELPYLVGIYQKNIPYYDMRHIIKPGLSGWAQIYGRHAHHGVGHEETADKLSHDLYYIKNRSVFLDLKIALQTLKVLLSFVGR